MAGHKDRGIAPCPFCGGKGRLGTGFTNPELTKKPMRIHSHWVECWASECEARGPRVFIWDPAIEGPLPEWMEPDKWLPPDKAAKKAKARWNAVAKRELEWRERLKAMKAVKV